MADLNFVVKNGLVVNGSFTANSTVVNTAAITATSVNATSLFTGGVSVNTMISGNASTSFANAVANAANFTTTTAATAYSNAVANAAALYQTMSGLSANVATLTANNSTNLGGQAASFYTNATNITTGTLPAARLSGSYSITAGDSFLLGGQASAFYRNASNINDGILPSARLSGSYPISISGSAGDSSLLGGQASAFYTNIPARLGYTPANKAGETFTGGVVATAFFVDTNQAYNMRSDGAVNMLWNGANIVFNQSVRSAVGFNTPLNISADGLYIGPSNTPPRLRANAAAINYVYFRWDGVDLYYNVDDTIERAIYYFGASDQRLKENVSNTQVDSLSLINQIKLRSFDWNAEGLKYQNIKPENRSVKIGLVAQELDQLIPEAVIKTTSQRKTDQEPVDTRLLKGEAIIPYLIGAIQQQQKQIDELKQLLATQ